MKVFNIDLLQCCKAINMMKQIAIAQNKPIKDQSKRYPYRAHDAGLFHAHWLVAFAKQTQVDRHHDKNEENKPGYKYQFVGHYLFLSVVKRTNCSKLSRDS